MGATFSRIKTWIAEVLTASDLNAEFDNILNNLTPAGVDDASATTTAMRTTADPYPGGVASLPTSLEGELQRLRYVIQQITKETYWYIDPSSIPKMFTGYTTRDIATTGDQAITGVGFQGRALIMLTCVSPGPMMSIGFSYNGNAGQCVCDYNDPNYGFLNANIAYLTVTAGATWATCIVKTMDSDGFTLTWGKNGSPTGTANFAYLVIG
jgi:hypothetical protein